MPTLLRMPEIAANATEAVLQDWSVEERGDFAARQPLATVETDKAVVEVESEGPGVLLKQLVAPGSQVQVGAPIALLGEPGEAVADLDAVLSDLEAVDEVPPAAPRRRPESDEPGGRRIFASPLARRLADEAGLRLADIDGTGPHDRITRRDVEAAAEARAGAPASSATGASEPADPADAADPADPADASEYREIPHSAMRRTIARRLTESKQQVPHFYVRATARVDRLLALRRELNEDAEVGVSLNDLVVLAAAAAHRRVPRMNVTWDDSALRQHESIDIALAVATDEGLLTPVLRGVDGLRVTELAARARELAERARGRRLHAPDLVGGSLTVSNLGMYGTEEFTAIINPPQAAVLAVGAARRSVVAGDVEPEVGTVMSLTLSADHRAVDGAHAAQWLQVLVTLLEHPVRLLA